MGAESYIYIKSNDVRFTVRIPGNCEYNLNQSINFEFDSDKIHIFDKETTETITN